LFTGKSAAETEPHLRVLYRLNSHGISYTVVRECTRRRKSDLHLVVPGRQQGACAALVQHGGVRQPGEGGGASRPGAIGLHKRASQPADKLNGRISWQAVF
jgi:hypothetical protein